MIANSRLFIPISLGNHYYTNNLLRYILRSMVDTSRDSVIVICDELRRISYRQHSARKQESTIRSLVATQVDEFKRRLRHCGSEDCKNLRIDTWKETPDLLLLESARDSTLDIIRSNPDLVGLAISEMPTNGTAIGKTDFMTNHKIDLQLAYIATETAMSIHYNENLGYDFEVYRRGDGFIDKFYAAQHAWISNMVGHRISRRLVALESYSRVISETTPNEANVATTPSS